MPSTDARTSRAIADLKTAYIWSINQAVEAGRGELVQELAESYEREAGDIMAGRVPVGEYPTAA